MNRNHDVNNLEQASFRPAPLFITACVILAVAGAVGIILAFIFGPNVDGWLWLNVGFLIFGGFAQGMLTWAAVFRVTQARWSPVVNRLGHSAIGFMPIAFLLLLVLLIGAGEYMPWVNAPVPEKEGWLNVPFLVFRNIILVVGLFILDYLLVRYSLKADAKIARGGRLEAREQYRLTAIGIALVILYTITFTIISWDFIMSLSPRWISTMFAPYYFVGNLYVGIAVLILMSALLRYRLGVERYLDIGQFHDMGNLMLGFGLFTMGLFFAQYLTIWYGNMPMETFFIIERYRYGLWPYLGWTAFIIGYAVPFVLLISRPLKRNPRLLAPVAVLAILGNMLERYVLVVPSLKPAQLLLYPAGFLVLLGLAGLFVLVLLLFLWKYPPVSMAEAALPDIETLEAVT